MTLDRLNMTQTSSLILMDLRSLTAQALPIVDNVFDTAKSTLRAMVTDDGHISGALIEANQTAAHGGALALVASLVSPYSFCNFL